MKLQAIVAEDETGGIAKNGSIPWDNDEQQLFRDITDGGTLIVGRKTYETIPQLTNRTIIVLSRTLDAPSNGYIARTPFDALRIAVELRQPVFVAGGRQVYSLYSKLVDRLHVSTVDGNYDCDVKFPIEHYFHLTSTAKLVRYDWGRYLLMERSWHG